MIEQALKKDVLGYMAFSKFKSIFAHFKESFTSFYDKFSDEYKELSGGSMAFRAGVGLGKWGKDFVKRRPLVPVERSQSVLSKTATLTHGKDIKDFITLIKNNFILTTRNIVLYLLINNNCLDSEPTRVMDGYKEYLELRRLEHDDNWSENNPLMNYIENQLVDLHRREEEKKEVDPATGNKRKKEMEQEQQRGVRPRLSASASCLQPSVVGCMKNFWKRIFTIRTDTDELNIQKCFELYFILYIKETHSYDLLDNNDIENWFLIILYLFILDMYTGLELCCRETVPILSCFSADSLTDESSDFIDKITWSINSIDNSGDQRNKISNMFEDLYKNNKHKLNEEGSCFLF